MVRLTVRLLLRGGQGVTPKPYRKHLSNIWALPSLEYDSLIVNMDFTLW